MSVKRKVTVPLGPLAIGTPPLAVVATTFVDNSGITRAKSVPVQRLPDLAQGAATLPFYAKYLGAIRWLFHGQFSGQDKWMVEVTDAPPERLYRPDESLLQWRKLAEDVTEERVDRLKEQGITAEHGKPEVTR